MTKAELVFVPCPGMGHLPSAVELAKLITKRHPQISVLILIINPPFDNSAVNAFVDSQSRKADPTHLTFISLPTISNPPDPASRSFFSTYIELHKPLVKQAVLDRIVSGSAKPVGFVLDMFCTAFIDVANELQVPPYSYLTSGVNFLNLMFHFQSLADRDGVSVADEFRDPDKEIDVPGYRNRVPGKVIPAGFLDKEGGGSEMLISIARRFRETKGLLVNSYGELESFGIRGLLEQAADNKVPTVYPVGPVLELGDKTRGASEKELGSIMEWLDEQPQSSVVFLCFGSMGSFGEAQVKEIANGLERSGHRFLWSLRKPPPPGKYALSSQHETFLEALPEGFIERTAERGKIIGWAPQVAILGHPAVGGFVSHCGWNSTLESMWFGVPMATWPIYAEQQLNAFTLVKELEVGVEIRMDYRCSFRETKGNFVVSLEEIENGIRKLMSMDEKKKGKVKEISEKGRKALEDGGSSYHNLGRFIKDILH